MRFDVWLIDSITSLMHLIEKDLDRDDAIAWWEDWHDRERGHVDCVCVLSPSTIEMPKTINAAA